MDFLSQFWKRTQQRYPLSPSLKHQSESSPQSHSPVAFFGILQSQLLEFLIHLFVEVISKEEGPEAEKSVHLLRLANAQAFSL